MDKLLSFLLAIFVLVVTIGIFRLDALEEKARQAVLFQEYHELKYEIERLRQFIRFVERHPVPLPPPAQNKPQRAPTTRYMWVYAPGLAPAPAPAYTSFQGTQIWDS